MQDCQIIDGRKFREEKLQKAFIEMHVQQQKNSNIQSANPKEQARSAFRRKLKAAENGRIVKADKGVIWVLEND